MTKEQIEFLKNLQQELNTQNTVGQADPRFWVVAQYEWKPCWEDHAEKTVIWCPELEKEFESIEDIRNEFLEAGYIDEEKLEELKDMDEWENEDALKEILDFYNVPQRKEHVIKENTMFLTLRECKEHIERNHYHYNDTVHPYAMTAWRSPQVEQLIKLLKKAKFDEIEVE